ncbi:hypothetical protein A3Q56_08179 [Intoshia linei]|uniref:RING-Gid-type domain-containing protein n=1 Tax=Intoshia linei TaxID=1819745 RepID=A0A177AQ26_9BILA|nr:hypothetical protein A3Q56_08179 [Intoshia linei]
MKSEIRLLEYQTLKTPYEAFNRVYRSAQKNIERECVNVTNAISRYNEALSTNDSDYIQHLMLSIKEHLIILKEKFLEHVTQQQAYAEKLRIRLLPIEEYEKEPVRSGVNAFQKNQLYRFVVDYLLRNKCFDIANSIANDFNIRSLTDIDEFINLRKYLHDLAVGKTEEPIQWCVSNKSKLRKINSNIEQKIRIKIFYEFCVCGKIKEAISYASNFLVCKEFEWKFIQGIVSIVLFCKEGTTTHPLDINDKYQLSSYSWPRLAYELEHDFYKIYNMKSESNLEMLCKIGISCLKTQDCYNVARRKMDCPVCSPIINILAKDLPFSHMTKTVLLCGICDKLMNDENPPMYLPNGNVYCHSVIVFLLV